MNKITKFLTTISVSAAFMFSAAIVHAAPEVGVKAPEFTMTDTQGNLVTSADLVGKTVVLEWTNHDCPFVRKHYDSGNMQALQKEATQDDVVWVSVISSAEGKQGNVSASEADALTSERNAAPSHVLLDADGVIGKAYEARTTPHMFVIDPAGKVAYMGGIDDKPTADKADIEGAQNYVRSALAELKDGNAVSTPASRPYGCSVKYAS